MAHSQGHTSISQSLRSHSQYLRLPKGQECRVHVPRGNGDVLVSFTEGHFGPRYEMLWTHPPGPAIVTKPGPWGPAASAGKSCSSLAPWGL